MNRLQDSAWQYVAEVIRTEDLPMLAAHSLVEGHDSPALRELAGLPCRGHAELVRELYFRALDELGVPVPDEETAGRRLLVGLAFGLVQGELSPGDVTARLSMAVAARTPEETRFLSLAVGHDAPAGPDDPAGWELDLYSAARSLAASTDLAPSASSRVRGGAC
ncbi:hypothetical protein [Streptomyces wuyuanensis]|uniref:hypothetical protein n=1 Tax=Streptomyces wuyuanensis TaxID=1196353 RepID=UPI00342A3779